jgi:hypothetical protein
MSALMIVVRRDVPTNNGVPATGAQSARGHCAATMPYQRAYRSRFFRGGFPMKLRVALVALACALVLGLVGSVFVPSPSVAKCTDPPGGTDCK